LRLKWKKTGVKSFCGARYYFLLFNEDYILKGEYNERFGIGII